MEFTKMQQLEILRSHTDILQEQLLKIREVMSSLADELDVCDICLQTSHDCQCC